MMNVSRLLSVIMVSGMVFCSYAAAAEDNANDIKSLKAEISGLRTELSGMRQELQGLRSDIKNMSVQIQRAATQPARPVTTRPIDTTIYTINTSSSPVRGAKDAPVTIVEFFDIQCPFCVREDPTLKKVLEQYPDKVRLVVKHFPLTFHKKAKPAHAAMELAFREGGADAFWKMHDMIIANPSKMEVTDLRGYTEKLGLNLTKFDETIADETKINALLATDLAEALKCKVNGTPTVLINGLKLVDRKIESYKARIDQILKEADTKK
jgi:protein-disulfide isomerase